MRKKWICVLDIITAILFAACGNPVDTVKEGSDAAPAGVSVEEQTNADPESVVEKQIAIEEQASVESETGTTVVSAVSAEAEAKEPETNDTLPANILMENPSWEYYIAEETESTTVPFQINVLEQKENEITDEEAWFQKNELEVETEATDGEYSCDISGDGTMIYVSKGGVPVAELDFSVYMYSDDLKPEDRDFVDETIHHVIVEDGILYMSIFHYTYAESAPSNAYIAAISLEDYRVLWKTAPLTCNSLNFEMVGDVIFCGYGFTAEDDNLYQVDKKTGKVLASETLKSKADYIIYKDDKLYVRTYHTDYVFEVKE